MYGSLTSRGSVVCQTTPCLCATSQPSYSFFASHWRTFGLLHESDHSFHRIIVIRESGKFGGYHIYDVNDEIFRVRPALDQLAHRRSHVLGSP